VILAVLVATAVAFYYGKRRATYSLGQTGCMMPNPIYSTQSGGSDHSSASREAPADRKYTFGNDTYSVDVVSMVQKNTSTNYVRKIRRQAANVWEWEDGQQSSDEWKAYAPEVAKELEESYNSAQMAKSVQGPYSLERKLWVTDGMSPCFQTLDRGSSEYTTVANRFNETFASKTIVQIQRVENKSQHERFCIMRDNTINQLRTLPEYSPAVDSEVQLLFHGTSPDNTIDKICKNPICGFAPLKSGDRTGDIYGRGTYFAHNAKYSDNYAATREDGTKRLILASVVVGKWELGKQGMSITNVIRGSEYLTFTSLVNDVTRPTIYVVQQGCQVYPSYVITYK